MMVRFGVMPLSTQLFKVTDSIQSFFTESENGTYQKCTKMFLNILSGEVRNDKHNQISVEKAMLIMQRRIYTVNAKKQTYILK